MADRSVVVRLTAQVASYVADLGRAKKSTDDLAKATEAAGKSQEQASRQTDQSSRKTAAALADEARAAQDAAKALGLSYNASGQLVDGNKKVLSSAQAAAHGMDGFSDSVYLTAHAADQAKGSLAESGSMFDRVAASAKAHRETLDTVGTATTVFGAATVGALALVTKAAMDWESAWAGVTKTVNGTPEQLAELESGLRGLATTLPITHTELAGVAEAAGQLGVKREDILGFTKTMVDLGVSTNLTAEEAATSIAQISNVMGTMAREGSEGVSRFGATLVALGNAGASTEKDILAMATRIAGAGATVGASEAEVLALSNTLASMGIHAELGGGVTTRVLLGIYSAVQSGGTKLEAFAKTAGVTSAEFAKAFADSPVKALDMVDHGLARIKDSGGNVVTALTSMGIKGTESTQVMLALANSGNLLSDSLDLGSKSWNENTALIAEATKRYETTESKVKVAWNNIQDSAISAGAVILPVVAGIADSVSGLAKAFGDIPAPIQGALTGIAGVAGVAALAAGGLMLVVPRALDTVEAFKKISSSSSGAASGLSKVGKTAGVVGGLVAVTTVLAKMAESSYMAEIDTGMGKVENAFAGIASGAPDAAKGLDLVFKDRSGGDLINGVTDLDSAIKRTFNRDAGQQFNDWGEGIVNTLTGVKGSSQILEDTWKRNDAALAEMVSNGNLEGASKGFDAIKSAAEGQGVSVEDLAKKFPEYADALAAADAASKGAAGSADAASGAIKGVGDASGSTSALTKEVTDALEEIGVSAQGTVTDLAKFTDALIAAGLATMSSRDASFKWQETLRGMDEKVAGVKALGGVLNDTATDFNKQTDAGNKANEMWQGYIQDGLATASTYSKDTSKSLTDVSTQLVSTYNAGVKSAEGLGLSTEAAQALVRETMHIPPGVSIESWMSDEARRMAEETSGVITNMPKSVEIASWMSDAAKLTGDATKKSVDDIPTQARIDSWMGDNAFQEALRTKAAALEIPEKEVIDSFMSDAARNEAGATTAKVLGIPEGASISSFMENFARLEAERTKSAVDNIPGYKEVRIATIQEYITKYSTEKGRASLEEAQNGGGATGGLVSELVGGFAGGGRVPGRSPIDKRVDNLLAMAGGKPFGIRSGEWIINEDQSAKNDKWLRAVNAGLNLDDVFGALSAAPAQQFQPPLSSYIAASSGAAPSITHETRIEQVVVKDVNEMARKLQTVRQDALTMSRLQAQEVRSQ